MTSTDELPLLCTLAGGGEGMPLFLVPSAGTTPLSLVRLARAIDPKRPVHSFGFAGMEDGRPPHETVEDMARAYVAEVRGAQATGPYLVGGHCLGGLVALEMAAQIEAAGEKVAGLVLLDTMAPFDRTVWRDGSDPDTPQSGSPALRAQLDQVLESVREQTSRQHAELPANEAERMWRIMGIHGQASFRYRGRGTHAPLVLLRTSDGRGELFDGWESMTTEGFCAVPVPGDTFSMLKPPHVGEAGKQLGAALAELGC